MPEELAKLEVRIGHKFRDRRILTQALRHPSVGDRQPADYERMEFLGDRVLGLVTAELLFRAYSSATVGELHAYQQQLIQNSICADIASQLGLGKFLTLGRSMKRSKTQLSPSILSDALEALVGAVFLDSGFDAAQSVIRKLWGRRIRSIKSPKQNPKTELQEWSQGQGLGLPTYDTLVGTGPRTRVRVKVGKNLIARATADTRREAEQLAAERLLLRVHSNG